MPELQADVGPGGRPSGRRAGGRPAGGRDARVGILTDFNWGVPCTNGIVQAPGGTFKWMTGCRNYKHTRHHGQPGLAQVIAWRDKICQTISQTPDSGHVIVLRWF